MKKGLKITLISITAVVLVLGIAVVILVINSNRIIKYELESFLGKDFSVGRIDLYWNRIEALDIRFKNPASKEVFRVDKLILEADFIGLLKKEYVISNLFLENPYILLEKNNQGGLVSPPFFRKDSNKGEAEKQVIPLIIKNIRITKGSLDYLDRGGLVESVLTKVRDIELDFKDIMMPFSDNFSTYTVSANIPKNISTGKIKSSGNIKTKTMDMDGKIEIRSLDITGFKPYFQKQGNVNVTKGFLDLDMNISIASGKINAPGKVALRDLEFETGSGIGGKFLGMPLAVITTFLKNNNNEIVTNFTLEGDLDNPRFNLRESLIDKITLGLAEKLGLSVTKIGESIIGFGAGGLKQIGKDVKDVGAGINRIFK
jgi:hypothetical protein